LVRVLYLGGLGRSGTTLLERLLGELNGVCPLGEVVHLWQRDVRDDERCACGKHFSDCEFWYQVGQRAFGGWHHVDVWRVLAMRDMVERTRFIPRLARLGRWDQHRVLVAEYADYYARLYTAAAEVSGAQVVVDSSKHAALAFCLRYAPQLDLRVVHMVRDSRGVAYSWTKRVTRPETDGTDEMTRYPPVRSAVLWNVHNMAFGLLRRCGVPTMRVRYEELLAEPSATVTRIAEFAGQTYVSTVDYLRMDQAGTPIATLGPCHSAAGNPMRFKVGEIPLRRDDAWRDKLPTAQRRLVGVLTAPLLGAYGYRGRS
jgi:hypothetical protein